MKPEKELMLVVLAAIFRGFGRFVRIAIASEEELRLV